VEDLVFLKSSQASQNSTFSSLNSDFKNVLKAAKPSGEKTCEEMGRGKLKGCCRLHLYIYTHEYMQCR